MYFIRCLLDLGDLGGTQIAKDQCKKVGSQIWTPRFVGEETHVPKLFGM